jgi:hypothetical protein
MVSFVVQRLSLPEYSGLGGANALAVKPFAAGALLKCLFCHFICFFILITLFWLTTIVKYMPCKKISTIQELKLLFKIHLSFF